jgi:hypothetical protein
MEVVRRGFTEIRLSLHQTRLRRNGFASRLGTRRLDAALSGICARIHAQASWWCVEPAPLKIAAEWVTSTQIAKERVPMTRKSNSRAVSLPTSVG